jgi:hypothetical protein
MRDLRRYSVSVIVHNAGQVNIAADRGQQVNVQQKKNKTTKAKQQGGAGTPRARRLKAVK